MNKINNNRLPFIRLYNTIDILINKHGYSMYVTKDVLFILFISVSPFYN